MHAMEHREVAIAPTAREQIAILLGGVTTGGSFSARRTAPADTLPIEVKGIGALRFPVPAAQARQLRGIAHSARYGQGTQTLLDGRVRDTWEVPLSRVKIDKRRWNRTLQPVLEGLRADLGLPAGSRLVAELQSMLVYTKGQFFAPHQDSEKSDEMVASLVVTLPSSLKGGSLVVEHRGEAATYRGSKQLLSLVAFYADCRHEIRPVQAGHRIVLTYNLVLLGDRPATTVKAAPGAAEVLAGSLREHFATSLRQRPGGRGGDAGERPPNRLVYLLDHQYTERGVSWARLKGDDAARVAALRASAELADCDAVLALADIHETWSCFENDWGGGWRPRGVGRRWNDNDDDDDFEAEPDEFELDELVDWEITLDRWIDPSGGPAEPIVTTVSDVEVCSTTPSVALQPYASEFEGYMGNYGNTTDRWYRRGAVVVWPHERAFAVRAEASPEWAVKRLWETVRSGEVAAAREMAATLAPFWNAVAGGELQRGFAARVLRVATALDHPALAATLLEPFDVEIVTPGSATQMVALVEQYGEQWTAALLAGWSIGRRRWLPSRPGDRRAWSALLARLCAALHAVNTTTRGKVTGRLLLQDTWRWLDAEINRASDALPPSHRQAALGDLAPSVLGFLSATAVIGAGDVRDQALRTLCVDDDQALLACVIKALRTAARATAALAPAAAGLDALAHHSERQLRARLARPARADGDWSIAAPGGCGCDLCAALDRFLTDSTRKQLDWPLAKDGRAHVHHTLDAHELPVRHQTRRTGRPYTLVLTKTDELIERERQARRRDETDLAWLLEHYDQ
jgi:hypothetical protein